MKNKKMVNVKKRINKVPKMKDIWDEDNNSYMAYKDQFGIEDVDAIKSLRTSLSYFDWAYSDVRGIKDSADFISEVDSSIAMLHEMKPADPIEAQLIIQMIATHKLSIFWMRKLIQNSNMSDLKAVANISNISHKLSKTYISLVESLSRYRRKGEQTVRVEHVTVSDGGKAVFGDVNTNKGEGRDHFEK